MECCCFDACFFIAEPTAKRNVDHIFKLYKRQIIDIYTFDKIHILWIS